MLLVPVSEASLNPVVLTSVYIPDDNFMPHWSDKNNTDSARTALFGVYAPSRYGDLRTKYYANEAQHRRAQGSVAIDGKANKYVLCHCAGGAYLDCFSRDGAVCYP